MLRGGAIGFAVDDGEHRFAREKTEAREGLQLLRRHFEQAQRLALFEPLQAFLEPGALEIDIALFLLEALEPTLRLIEIGEDQLALDAFDRGE